MESHTTAPNTKPTSSDSYHEDAPLLNLLSIDPTGYSPEELRAQIIQLREISSSPHSLRKALSDQKETKPKALSKAAQAEKDLLSKYLG